MDLDNVVGECVVGDDVKKEDENEIKLEPEEEKMEVEEEKPKVNEKTPVKKSVRTRNRETATEEYLNFMREKYYENKDNVWTLELLKDHPAKLEDIDLVNVSDALMKRSFY